MNVMIKLDQQVEAGTRPLAGIFWRIRVFMYVNVYKNTHKQITVVDLPVETFLPACFDCLEF